MNETHPNLNSYRQAGVNWRRPGQSPKWRPRVQVLIGNIGGACITTRLGPDLGYRPRAGCKGWGLILTDNRSGTLVVSRIAATRRSVPSTR